MAVLNQASNQGSAALLAPIDTQPFHISVGNNNSNAFNPPSALPDWALAGFQGANADATAVQPQGGGQSGGSKLISDIGNVKSASNFLSGNSFSSLISGIDRFGNANLGFGLAKGAPVIGGYGPSAVAQAGSTFSGTLSSALGGAGFGFAAGGFLAGLVGGNKIGGSIGGAIGGALGSAFLGSLGAGIGAEALGATIGSILPGPGTIIGAVAGSLLGGMFGGHSIPHPGQGFAGTLSDTGGYDPKTISLTSKHSDTKYSDTLSKDLSAQLQSWNTDIGAKINPYVVGAGFKTGSEGGRAGVKGANGYITVNGAGPDGKDAVTWFDANDQDARQKAIDSASTTILKNSGATDAQIAAAIAKAKAGTTGTNPNPVIIPPHADSSREWDTFLAKYRTDHTSPPTTTPPTP